MPSSHVEVSIERDVTATHLYTLLFASHTHCTHMKAKLDCVVCEVGMWEIKYLKHIPCFKGGIRVLGWMDQVNGINGVNNECA